MAGTPVLIPPIVVAAEETYAEENETPAVLDGNQVGAIFAAGLGVVLLLLSEIAAQRGRRRPQRHRRAQPYHQLWLRHERPFGHSDERPE